MLSNVAEDIDYQLIPDEGDHWNVRLMTEYPETVIKFGTVKFDGKSKTLRWNMEIISSPDPDLTTEDLTFQDHCSIILQNIMDTQIAKGNAVLTDGGYHSEKTFQCFRTRHICNTLFIHRIF